MWAQSPPGQVCSAGTRLFVQRRIYTEFVDRLAAFARELRVGDPLDPDTQLGPLVSAAKIAREEIFGPVICALPFDTLEEAVTRGNDTNYGLGGGVPDTKPQQRAPRCEGPSYGIGLGELLSTHGSRRAVRWLQNQWHRARIRTRAHRRISGDEGRLDQNGLRGAVNASGSRPNAKAHKARPCRPLAGKRAFPLCIMPRPPHIRAMASLTEAERAAYDVLRARGLLLEQARMPHHF